MPDRGREATPSKRVFFHVGAPKTGTTYLQQRLFKNRAALADDGVLYPYATFGESFRSVHDFCGTGWGGGDPAQFRGEWGAVAARIRDWTGPTAIVSNELFGNAPPARIRTGLGSIGPAEVHLIFTARDIARQLVSDWQEHIKHKHVVTLERFVDDLVELGIDAPRPFGQMFWGLHDPARVLGRWGEFVPAARIHLITVPQPGAPADTLWRRFAEVTGLEPTRYDDLGARANRSMGVIETELVRRMNRRLRRMPSDAYDQLVRRLLAERILGRRSHRLTLPADRMDWSLAWTEKLNAELEGRGYDIVGDLDELMPRPADHAPHVSPTSLTEAELAPAAMRVATRMILHAGRQRSTINDLRQQISGEFPPPPGGFAAPRPRPAGRGIRDRTQALLARVRSHR